MKKLLPLLPAIFVFCSFTALAQGELPVNMYTGSPIISIPIHSISAPGLSESMSLVYNSSGVKVDAPAGDYGVNWRLNAGGSVSREVRGLPDDYSRDGGAFRKGWLYPHVNATTVAAEIGSIPNTSDLSAACPNTDETADFAKLNVLFAHYDSEPDLFSYSVGGYSGNFVFDNGPTPQIRLIPYQDITITPAFASSTDKTIVSFTITTNTGEVYLFGQAVTETRWTENLSPANEIFKAEFEYYKASSAAGAVSYKTEWHLTKASSRAGGEINYLYSAKINGADSATNIISVKIHKETASGYKAYNIYNNHVTRSSWYLSGIRITWGPEISFTLGDELITSINIYDARDGDDNLFTSKFIKKYSLKYSGGNPKMLMSLQEISATDSIPSYRFGYSGWVKSDTRGQDLWGYYNGKTTNKDLYPQMYVYPALPEEERFRTHAIPGYTGDTLVLPGADRNVHTELVKSGSLNSITWPWGGTTTIEYESNQYYDAVAGKDIDGGGIRIKSATYLDGTNPDASIEKHFSYKDAQGRSSGVLISKPVFTIPLYENRGAYVVYYEDIDPALSLWKYFVARTTTDISSSQGTMGRAVGYKEVKVFRPGSGYAYYEYELPTATLPPVKFVRDANCPSAGIFARPGALNYPCVPGPDIDFKRGLVKRKRDYDSLNHLVSETVTTYQDIFKQGSTPHIVSGVKYDRVPNGSVLMFLFGKYAMETDAAKVVASETVTMFDANDISKHVTQSIAYFYESPVHRLLTRIERKNIEGIRYTRWLKYPLDYGSIPANPDTASAAIKRLQLKGVNGIPLEQYETRRTPGGTGKIVSSSVVRFSGFGKARELPQFSYGWNAASPVDSSVFVRSYVNPSGVFTIDPGYRLKTSYLAYDSMDTPSAVIGLDSIPVTTVWSTKFGGAPVALVSNALPGQFAFSDFETGTEASFSVKSDVEDGDYINYQHSAHSGRWSVIPAIKLSKIIDKAENTYRFTGWWNKGATQITVNIAIKNTAQAILHSQSHVLNKSTTSAPWDYFSFDVPVSVAPSQFFVEISFTFSGTYDPPGAFVAIDDFAFYPKHSVLTSTTYTFPFGADSSTSEDRSGFQVYDNLGRVKLILDRDKNILQRKTYQFYKN